MRVIASSPSLVVGAIFEFRDSATLKRLSGLFRTVGEQIAGVQEKLMVLGKGEGLFGGQLAGMEKVAGAIAGLATSAGRAGAVMAETSRCYGKLRSLRLSHAPSKPGNNAPAVIPIRANSFII